MRHGQYLVLDLKGIATQLSELRNTLVSSQCYHLDFLSIN